MLAVLTACGGESLGDSGDSGGASAKEAVKVGVLVTLSGPFAQLGRDMQAGIELYLDTHGGKLGGRDVNLEVVDEGESPQTGVAAATRLAQSRDIDVVTGIVTSPTAMAAREVFHSAQMPVLLGNTGAAALGAKLKSDWIWRASYDNLDPGRLLGADVAKDISVGDFFLIGADYAAGHEHLDGFKEDFPSTRIKGELYTPFGTTSDYSPYLAKIRASGAKNVAAFFAGREAIEFVKQFEAFGLSTSVKLYGFGFLTEGTALTAEGTAALGVKNVTRYNWDLDNPENAAFVKAYEQKHGAVPTIYAATMYDIGLLLDKAVMSINGEVTRDTLQQAIKSLGAVSTVRGEVTFRQNNTISQTFHLTEVRQTDQGPRNVVVKNLGRS
jgi:branched-chain amino acid transport system substrate-binding protein